VKTAIVALTCWLLSGCVTLSTPVMNADGKIVDCSAKGGGFGLGFFVGLGEAASMRGDCVSNAAALGYLPVKDGGTIAIDMTDMGGHIEVTRVRGGSTANEAGIKPGDIVAEIGGTKPASVEEAKRLLYGKIGTTVVVTLQLAGRDFNLKIKREAYGKATGLAST